MIKSNTFGSMIMTLSYTFNESDRVTEKQSNTVIDGDKAMLAVEEKETETKGVDTPDACQCACQPRQNNFLKLTS